MTSASEASRPDADLLERLRHIDTASLSDADGNLGLLSPAVIGALEIGGVGDVLVVAAGVAKRWGEGASARSDTVEHLSLPASGPSQRSQNMSART
jgi:hypothetical protein